MKRFIFLLLLVIFFSKNILAHHIIGGEMRYEYVGVGAAPNTKIYNIKLLLMKGEALQTADLDPSYVIAIFNNDNNQKVIGDAGSGTTSTTTDGFNNWIIHEDFVGKLPVPINQSTCIQPQITHNYTYKTYTLQITLPNNNTGYTVAIQTYSREESNNVIDPMGACYSCIIPGLNTLPLPLIDNSPKYKLPIAIICANNPFTFDFGATDSDGDSLVYSFCDAYYGGAAGGSPFNNTTLPIDVSVTYQGVYTATSPLGIQATINAHTGVISGIAPPVGTTGRYVLCVCAAEYKNGVYITTHRKDLIIEVSVCNPLTAQSNFTPITCDGFDVTFADGSSGTPTDFYWDFGDPASGVNNTSTLQNPNHVFTIAGIYNIKHKVAIAGQCSDSVTKPLSVFPGFFPLFTKTGQCKNSFIQFNDATTTNYGVVDTWSWNFGDPSTLADTSHVQNPTYTFTNTGTYTVTLQVTNSKGCNKTITQDILITDKPPLSVFPKDTLICSIDTLQINAIGTGTFIWTPNYMINSQSSQNPLVSPDVTTTYFVQLTDPFGCVGKDSIKINVTPSVSLTGPADTGICKTDSIKLNILSNATNYTWLPNDGSLSSNSIADPIAKPLVNTTYFLTANIGKCVKQDTINIKVAPYPTANAGPDSIVCFGKSYQLNATGGSIYTWHPSAFLTATNIANPVSIMPTVSVRYIVNVSDTLGCPKIVNDTINLTVVRVKASAGNDTSVVFGQPLQLTATGSNNYLWTPSTWLSDSTIFNPISKPQNTIRYFVKVFNNIGCFDTASLLVTLFRVPSGLYVPNAFTPNGDGKNDVFRPIPLGMKSINKFMIYNRWGNLVYESTSMEKGWNGRFKGKPQDPDTYVWYVEGTTFEDKIISKKGYVVLIR